MESLLANALEEPVSNGGQYDVPPTNAKLFEDGPGSVGPHLMRQQAIGDCYFDAAVAAILKQDPAFARTLVTPSSHGVPGNV